MNIAIRHTALGAAVATALILGGGREAFVPSAARPASIGVPLWEAGRQAAFAPTAALAGALKTYGIRALGFALDAVFEAAAELKRIDP